MRPTCRAQAFSEPGTCNAGYERAGPGGGDAQRCRPRPAGSAVVVRRMDRSHWTAVAIRGHQAVYPATLPGTRLAAEPRSEVCRTAARPSFVLGTSRAA